MNTNRRTNRRTRGHITRAALIAAVALTLGGLTGHVAARADDAPCVPTAGQDYVPPTYAVEAEYTRTIPGTDPQGPETIPNPDHVPAWTETIQHPAETHVVTHPAQYATEHQYVKQVRGIIQQQTGHGRWQDTGQTFGWETWSGNSTRWEAADFTESGPHSAVQSTDGKKRKLTTEYRYVQTGQTRQGAQTKPAWDETVVDREAWTETVEHDATGGEPTIPNPDYVPGTESTAEMTWSTIEPAGDGWTPTGATRTGEGLTEMTDPGQPAIDPVVCEDPEEPTDPETPVDPADPGTDTPTTPAPTDQPTTATPVAAPVTVTPTPNTPAPAVEQPAARELAHTGTSVATGAIIATGLVLAGGLLLAARHRRTTR